MWAPSINRFVQLLYGKQFAAQRALAAFSFIRHRGRFPKPSPKAFPTDWIASGAASVRSDLTGATAAPRHCNGTSGLSGSVSGYALYSQESVMEFWQCDPIFCASITRHRLVYPPAEKDMANVSKLIFGAAIAAASIVSPALAAHKGKQISAHRNGYVTRSSQRSGAVPTPSCPGLPYCDPATGISYPRGEPGGAGPLMLFICARVDSVAPAAWRNSPQSAARKSQQKKAAIQ